ncbi:M1 family metallopeptidase, partial [candidate division KSB1 bacterium]|nr:M1 family metallopeptidase [candidate division KSB1 bacterium]NIR71615.1 M1 family metallopeptidase [candidate division KSB1 bacterium]NIS23450.1 M1 family metallopeptidase [candidate division KSB1 bacterium]NIT70358.1 M1 family metallopeptidase [candidate division KSB1 bacterium]NIU24060.1 M1 family metallopeptidase [candidate division KSB1 bacterium]
MNNGIRLLFTVGVLILSTPTYPQSSTSVLSSQDILQLYKDVKNLNFDESRVANVENVTFAKDRAIFAFQKGTFYFVEPVREHITGAIFLGEGSLSLDPPTEIERAQVRRFLEADSLLETFSAAYLRFTGQAAHDLIKDLTFTQAEIPDKVTELHEEISDYFLKERGINLASGVLGDLLNGAEEGLFFAVLEKKQPELNFSSYLAFIFEPNASEEVALFQYFPRRSKKPFYTVCSFHRTNDYQSGDAFFSTVEEDDDALQISHYKMQVKLEKSGKLNTEAELTYSPLVDNLRFLTFVLYQELEVDSVNNVLGETLAFIQEEKEAAFSVILDEPLLPQTEQTLTVYYSGDALEPANGNLLLKNKVYWYPRYGYLVPATYDITFEYPSDWQVISVGAKIERWEDGSSAFSRWLEDTPAFGAAFAFGYFDSTTYDSENVLPIKVYSSHSRATSIRAKIGGDVANSLYFFESLLGHYPYKHMNVVETPGVGSQGFPALLFLTSHTFAREIEGVMEALRGHEVAHQWWGNLVGWETY